MIASICSEPTVLKVMKYVNLFISIIRIVVPIILIFVASFRFISVIKTGDEDNLNKVKKSVITNAIAAVVIFLIPNLVSLIVNMSFSENDYKNCLEANDAIIVQAYEDKLGNLVSKAEETLNIYDYNAAQLYLKNIKDEEKRKAFEERLAAVKEQIDKLNIRIDYSNFSWSYYDSYSGPISNYNSNTMPYAIWGPSNINDLKEVSLPLIIWLHGGVVPSKYCYIENINKNRFIKTISNWSSTGLEPIPAIIIAPMFCDPVETNWGNPRAENTIKGIIEFAINEYNVDKNNIVLMGHSDGGSGVVYVSRKNQDLFSKLVVMSGFMGFNDAPDYYKRIPLKGYTTKNPARGSDPNGGGDGNTGMVNSFMRIGRLSDLYQFPKEVTHDEVQEKAMTLDENNNGKSDLIEWIIGE